MQGHVKILGFPYKFISTQKDVFRDQKLREAVTIQKDLVILQIPRGQPAVSKRNYILFLDTWSTFLDGSGINWNSTLLPLPWKLWALARACPKEAEQHHSCADIPQLCGFCFLHLSTPFLYWHSDYLGFLEENRTKIRLKQFFKDGKKRNTIITNYIFLLNGRIYNYQIQPGKKTQFIHKPGQGRLFMFPKKHKDNVSPFTLLGVAGIENH